MSTQALVVSTDAMVLNTIPRMLQENGTDPAICREPKLALQMLARTRVDELFVDCDGLEGAADVLRSLKYVPSPAAVLRCAISSGKTSTQQAFEAGANFVIQKPVHRSTLGPVLRAAQGMIDRERRRSYRHQISVHGQFDLGSVERDCLVVNVSETGACFRSNGVLTTGSRISLYFRLPGTSAMFVSDAEVVWSGVEDRTGVRFIQIPPFAKITFRQWLADRFLQLTESEARQ